MIVVTGANGHLGRLIVERLLERRPAHEVGVSVRDPGKAADLAARGVRVRPGDFARPDGLVAAFEGATQVLLVSSNARATGGDALPQHRAAIDAARSARVRRIVYTSHMGASDASAFPPMRDHAATEAMLAGAGIAWTALRNGFYASTVPRLVGPAATTGVLEAPQDGKVSWTAHADLAAAAARVLADEGRFDGPTPPFTGAEALDLADVASLLPAVHGRPVVRRTISDAEKEASMAAAGLPASVLDTVLGLFRAARAGEFAAVDPALGRLIGRRPASLRDVLAA